MTARYVLELPVNPVPLARPRVVNNAGWQGAPRAYTPDPTDFVPAFRTALLGCRGRPRAPLAGPLDLTIRLWRRCSSSSNRGDLDNLVKAIGDAGNGHLWADDKQIEGLTASIEGSGPAVDGRIFLIIRDLPTRRDEAGARSLMSATLGRLDRLAQAHYTHADAHGAAGAVADVDQLRATLRGWLGRVHADLDDPLVRRTALRVIDGMAVTLLRHPNRHTAGFLCELAAAALDATPRKADR